MTTILNDVVLNKLLCSECDNYLSVLPVKVYPNRVIKCGRCCADNDDGTESMFNQVVKKCVFKCMNRYDKCNKLLPISEVKEHERRCISGTYQCPKCEHKFSGSASQLLLHYTRQHPKSILNNDTFLLKVKRDIRERYLYLVKDIILFVLVENLSKEKILYLSIVSLKKLKNVKQWFSIKPLNKQANSFSTESKKCCSLDNFDCDYFNISTNSMYAVSCKIYLDLSEEISLVDELSISFNDATKEKIDNVVIDLPKIDESQLQETNTTTTCSQTIPFKDVFGVKLTDKFKTEYPGYELTACGTALFKGEERIELTCSNCKQLTGCNVFNCQLNKHVVCWDCKAWCGICDIQVNGWNSDIAAFNELLLLPCKWRCGKYFHGNGLNQHQLSCEESKCTCPICKSGFSNLEQLCKHLVGYHKNYKNTTQFNLAGYLKECRGRNDTGVCFYQNGYWFRLYWVKASDTYEVRIEFFEKINHYELAIICDSDKSYNRIDNNKITFVLSDNPRFYLKRIRNL